jgi:hypothetical protein
MRVDRVASMAGASQQIGFGSPSRLRKKSTLYLILGGAALQRCDNRFVFTSGSSLLRGAKVITAEK